MIRITTIINIITLGQEERHGDDSGHDGDYGYECRGGDVDNWNYDQNETIAIDDNGSMLGIVELWMTMYEMKAM